MRALCRVLFIAPTDSVALQLLRALMVGGAAFVVDYGALLLLARAGLPTLIAASLAFLLGLAVNYALSMRSVFAGHESSRAGFVVFLATGAAGLGLNALLLWGLVDMIGIALALAKPLTAAAVFLFNYGTRRAFLYARGGNTSEGKGRT